MTAKKKPKALAFTARDYPVKSFLLPKDAGNRQWRHVAAERRHLYLQIASRGEIHTASADTLADLLGIHRATIFRLLDDLGELGCVVDGVDEQGHKYSAKYKTRVRRVSNDSLATKATAWHWVPEWQIHIQYEQHPIRGQKADAGVASSCNQESHLRITGVASSNVPDDQESQTDEETETRSSREDATQKNYYLAKEQTQPLNNEPRPVEAVVLELFREQQGTAISLRKVLPELKATVKAYTEAEVTEAVKRLIAEGTFDGIKAASYRATVLMEHLSAMLAVVRKGQEPDAVITPEMFEAKAKQVAEQFMSDEQQLEETLASWPESEIVARLEEENQKIIRDKIARLQKQIAEKKSNEQA